MSHVWDGSQIGVMTVIMNTARCTCMYVHVWYGFQIGVMTVIMNTARCTCMYVHVWDGFQIGVMIVIMRTAIGVMFGMLSCIQLGVHVCMSMFGMASR